ncbi:MAG: exo-alpha-sialidase [Chloroflexi bacterium]|nr:MAG: exo-alpha-sialidase [Chloroflexota bacterium]
MWALVAGARLFRSTDRAETWQEHFVAFDPVGSNREIAFIGESEGWLATPGPPGTQCTFQSVAITHTADAGATWVQLVPLAASASTGLADRQCKEHPVFADAQRGFLSAYDPNSAPIIYRTTDGGRTWIASAALADPPGFTTRGAGITLRAGRVRLFGTTALVDASGQVDGRLASYVFRSVDGGATWSYLASVPQGDGAFALVSAMRWLIATPGSSKETTDGGATWHAFTTDYSQAAPIAPEIVFGDPLVGYATVRGSIQRTVDGGANWSLIETPGT